MENGNEDTKAPSVAGNDKDDSLINATISNSPVNEYALEGTLEVLTVGSGEVGVAKKIVGFVQDCFRLDALDRIQQTQDPNNVCQELQKLMDLEIDDESFAEEAITKVRSIGETFLANGGRIDTNNLKIVLFAMEKYKKNVPILMKGCQLLANVLSPQAAVDLDEALMSVLVSEPNAVLLVTILQNYQENRDVVQDVFFLLGKMCIILFPGRDHPALTTALSETLERMNVLPLCVALTQKHHNPNDPTSNLVSVYAFPLCLMPIGGLGRPVLTNLMTAPNTGDFLNLWAERFRNAVGA